MKRYLLAILVINLFFTSVIAQKDTVNPNGYNKFYYDNGKISSEGNMRDREPDGYWKTYYEDGIIKSEGNRINFNLDDIWKFYDKEGKIQVEINYKNNKKNGIKKSFREKEYIEEFFVDDVKHGWSKHYFSDSKIKKTIKYVNGFEEGYEKIYSHKGLVVTLIKYKRGFVIQREHINRKDKNDLKQGKWMFFYKSGSIQLEGGYRNDRKHGFFKEYSKDGSLMNITKYINGEIQEDAEEVRELEVRTDYYKDGSVKIVATYNKGVPDGIRREYSPGGKIERSYIFKNGVMIGKGIIDESGFKQGYWKIFYYENRKLKAEGKYKNNKKTGLWKFYHLNGKLEQTGYFNKLGNYDGMWTWYYMSGNVLREENYFNGVLDGMMSEYLDNDSIKILAQGEYIDGLQNGPWFYELRDHKEEGKYVDGMRDGKWTHYYSKGIKSFEGKFIEDNPDGKHTHYWDNGKTKDVCFYEMGRKHGEWKKYRYDGSLFLVIYIKNGIEKKYDNVKIKPEIFEEDEP